MYIIRESNTGRHTCIYYKYIIYNNSCTCTTYIRSILSRSNYRYLLQSLIAPAKVDDKTLSELRQVLSGHFSPKRLVIAERFIQQYLHVEYMYLPHS